MLVLTRIVLGALKRYDYEQAFIIGKQGVGKTTYALLVMYEVYQDWDRVLHYTVFDPREVLPEFREALKTGKRIPVVLFDDAGFHLSKYLWSVDRDSQRLALTINALFNLIRTICAATIFTSPDLDVLKELRKKSWIVGQPVAPSGVHQPYRIMRLYRKTIMPDGRISVRYFAEDHYDLRAVPADVRKEYEEKRRAAIEPLLEMLEEVLDTATVPRLPRDKAERLAEILPQGVERAKKT